MFEIRIYAKHVTRGILAAMFPNADIFGPNVPSSNAVAYRAKVAQKRFRSEDAAKKWWHETTTDLAREFEPAGVTFYGEFTRPMGY
jgi:hypothetical protein